MNIEKIKKITKKSKSYREVSRKTGIYKQKIKKIIEENGIDHSHFDFGKRTASMVGNKFGMLTVIKIFNKKRNDGKRTRAFAKCRCECGKEKTIRADGLKRDYYISCGCHSKNRFNMMGNKNPAFKGVGEIGSSFLWNIKRSAGRRGLNFNLDLKYLNTIFKKQKGKCFFTDEKLYFGRIRVHHETNASLDRIDNSKGYIKGNVKWVTKDINMMRGSYDTKYFIELCKMVASKN